MNVTFDLNTILQGIAVVLAAAAVLGIFGMWRQLIKINGRLNKHEQWQDLHAQGDERQHTQARENIRDLWHEVNNIRGQTIAKD